MESHEDSSSTGSETSSSDKSNPAKTAESESPLGGISPGESSSKQSRPDRSDEAEPPSKILKQDTNSPVHLKDSGMILKKENQIFESLKAEDEIAMETDELPSVSSDLKSEIPDILVTSSETLSQDPAFSEPVSTPDDGEKDLVLVGKEPPLTSILEVSGLSETSNATLRSKESLPFDEDTLLAVSSSGISSNPSTSGKYLKKQEAMDAMDGEEILPSHIQPDTSSKPEKYGSLAIDDTNSVDDEKLSPRFDTSRESENMEIEIPSSKTEVRKELRPSRENLESEETPLVDKRFAASPSFQPDHLNEPGPSGGEKSKLLNPSCNESGLSSEPGPSSENPKTQNQSCFESGETSEPGPSGEHLKTEDLTSVGERKRSVFKEESFNLKKGIIGDQSLDEPTCENIWSKLSDKITRNQFVDCYNRLRGSYLNQRTIQEYDSVIRREQDFYTESQQECLENRDEISIRSWLKWYLPREADYLNSIAGKDDETEDIPDPPSLEDEDTYSLSSGNIAVEDRDRWRRAISLGEQLLRIGLDVDQNTPGQNLEHDNIPNPEYVYEAKLNEDLMNLLNELARQIRVDPVVNVPREDTDSGNVSDAQSLRRRPCLREDDTSFETSSIQSEEEPPLRAPTMRLYHERMIPVSYSTLEEEPSLEVDEVPLLSDVSLPCEESDKKETQDGSLAPEETDTKMETQDESLAPEEVDTKMETQVASLVPEETDTKMETQDGSLAPEETDTKGETQVACLVPEEIDTRLKTQSPRPKSSEQISRVISGESFDNIRSESPISYPKTESSSQSSSLDCSSIQEDIVMSEYPKEDQVASDLAEVHLDNDASESASCLGEVNLDIEEAESASCVGEAILDNDESEPTAYPNDGDTSEQKLQKDSDGVDDR